MITEKQIDDVLDKLESQEDFLAESMEKHSKINPAFFAHLQDEAFLLSVEERDYLYGMLVVILESSQFDLATLDSGSWSAVEDKHWDQISKYKKQEDFFNELFVDTKQEDLLAYAEDSLVELEDDVLTKVGRDFILVKTVSLIKLIK